MIRRGWRQAAGNEMKLQKHGKSLYAMVPGGNFSKSSCL